MAHPLLEYRPQLFGEKSCACVCRTRGGLSHELEGAAALLEAQTPPAIDSVLVALAQRARTNANSAAQRELRRLLRWVAGRVLPTPERAAGTSRTRPHQRWSNETGARAFGLELEGLSPEDGELQTAQAFTRLATDAIRFVGHDQGRGGPAQVALAALVRAARHQAPGLWRICARLSADGQWRGDGADGARPHVAAPSVSVAAVDRDRSHFTIE